MSAEEIFGVSPEERGNIEKFYNKTPEEINSVVKSLKKWYETQYHLPECSENTFFEMMLKLNKFNEEKTKKKIDMYFSMRNIVPEFYDNRSPLSLEMTNFMDTLMIVPLPQLTSTLERVYLIKFLDTDPTKFSIYSNAKYLLSLFDVRLHNDTAVGEIYLYDLAGLKCGHVFKVNPITVRKIYTVMEKAYSDRIRGIYFLNMPFIGNALISLAKLILNEKLISRVQSHKNLESLYEVVPSELLPEDYGGLQKPSWELYDKWKSFFYGKAPWLVEFANKKSNEELREDKNKCSVFSGIWNLFSST